MMVGGGGGGGVKVRRLGVRFVNGRLRRNTNDQTRDWVIQGEGATGRGGGEGVHAVSLNENVKPWSDYLREHGVSNEGLRSSGRGALSKYRCT